MTGRKRTSFYLQSRIALGIIIAFSWIFLAAVPAGFAEEPPVTGPQVPMEVLSPAAPVPEGETILLNFKGKVEIDGEPLVGSFLQAKVTLDPVTHPQEPPLEYQWRRDGENIENATNRDYNPTLEDAGHKLSCVVTAEGYDGESVSEESDVIQATAAIAAPFELVMGVGYGETRSDPFTVTGYPEPTVTFESDREEISWDDAEKRVNLAPGLPAGEYSVKLTASNGVGTPAEAIYLVLIDEPIFFGGPSSKVLIQGVELNMATPYWKNGTTTATANPTGYNVYYDAPNDLLKLNNAQIHGPWGKEGIRAYEALTIELAGDNSVESDYNDAILGQINSLIKTDLTITGGGTLALTAPFGEGLDGLNINIADSVGSITDHGGMRAEDNLTIAGGVVTSTGFHGIVATNGNVTISGGTVTAIGNEGDGVSARGGVKISSGTVTAIGNRGDGIVVSDGGVTISDATVILTGSSDGIRALSGNVTISSGTVTSTGSQDGIDVIAGNVMISGGTVTATGNSGTGIDVTVGVVKIGGGTVTMTGSLYAINSLDGFLLEGPYATAANRRIMAGNNAPGIDYTGTDPNADLNRVAAYKYVKVAPPPPPIAPTITDGDTALTVTVGYSATMTNRFTIDGYPVPVVTIESGVPAEITWNNAAKHLDIAPGLGVGDYRVVLKATNSAGEASHTFTLTVDPPITSEILVQGVELNDARPYWVNGAATATAAPGAGGYNAYYDAANKTLKLNNAVIIPPSAGIIGISTVDDLILEVPAGTNNSITNHTGIGILCGNVSGGHGKALTIRGGGKLTVVSHATTLNDDAVYAETLTIAADAGEISATSHGGAALRAKVGLQIDGGTVTANGKFVGILSDTAGVTISAGSITATGGQDAVQSSGDFTISKGTVTMTSTGVGSAINAVAGQFKLDGTYAIEANRLIMYGAAAPGSEFSDPILNHLNTACKYVKVSPRTPTAPTLTGPTTETLTVGYPATTVSGFIVGGNPAPTVLKTLGPAEITWDGTPKVLNIAPGLAAGTYQVVLKAENGVSPDATHRFTLTVNPAVTSKVFVQGVELNNVNPYWVNGAASATAVPGAGGYNAFFDAANGVLKLNNANINATSVGDSGIRADQVLTIEAESGTVNTVKSDYSHGIKGAAALTFRGGGKLTITGGSDGAGDYSGIDGDNVTIEAGAGEITASGVDNGIFAENTVTIQGGTVSASTTTPTGKVGIGAQNGAITISGGTVTATAASGNGHGIHAQNNNVVISGGTVTSTGTAVGISTLGSSITISGGVLTATASGSPSYAIDILAPGQLQLTGEYADPTKRTIMQGAAAPGTAYTGSNPHGDLNHNSAVQYLRISPSISISGVSMETLLEGYAATSIGPYTVNGYPVPLVNKVSGDAKLNWNPATNQIDIAAGLPIGTYPIVLNASNGVSPDTTFTFTLTIVKAPTLTGPAAVSLPEGYAAANTALFTVGGAPAPTVTVSGAAELSWNPVMKWIDIAPGLPAGLHPVILKASNGIPPDATFTFTLMVVKAAGLGGPPPTEIMLTAGYAATSSSAYTLTGFPVPSVIKVSGDAKLNWNPATNRIDIAAGLPVGTYPITLRISNGIGADVLTTFTVKVVNPPSPPAPPAPAPTKPSAGGGTTVRPTVDVYGSGYFRPTMTPGAMPSATEVPGRVNWSVQLGIVLLLRALLGI